MDRFCVIVKLTNKAGKISYTVLDRMPLDEFMSGINWGAITGVEIEEGILIVEKRK